MRLAAVYLLASCWLAAPPEAAQVTLGRALFFDPRLSADGQVACASCHDPRRGFVDGRAQAVGLGGRSGNRNTPTLLGVAAYDTFFWDGRAATLEAQVAGPLFNPLEMGLRSEAHLVAALNTPADTRAFLQALGSRPSLAGVAAALAAFERTLQAGPAPFDHYLAGDRAALSPWARRGWELFNGRARCHRCHAYDAQRRQFADALYHNIGIGGGEEQFVPLSQRASEMGRAVITQDARDMGAFRTPDLRNIGLTAPYMHDGSLQTLWDVMDHYNRGGDKNPHLDGEMVPLGLSEDDIDALVAWMFSLTGADYAELGEALWHAQWQRRNIRPERDAAGGAP